jgi:glutamate racemase
VKAIVVACNTATAHALPSLQAELPIPVIGVVEPGARAAVAASRRGELGVIGTAGTIGSGAYERAIKQLAPNAHILARACPLFVPLVEEGWLDTEATRLIAREYLAPMKAAGIDTLVLGCTHYPLLKPMLADMLGPDVRLIDSAQETAAETARVLGARDLLAPKNEHGWRRNTRIAHRFVASDAADHFLRIGQRFLGSAIECVETLTLG